MLLYGLPISQGNVPVKEKADVEQSTSARSKESLFMVIMLPYELPTSQGKCVGERKSRCRTIYIGSF